MTSKSPLLRTPKYGFVNRGAYQPIGPLNSTDIESQEEKGKKETKSKAWSAAILAASILAVIMSAIALGFGGWSFTEVNHYSSPSVLLTSGPINYSPYSIYLGGTGAPMAMTLPNDLSPYVGKIYRVWSLSNQPHTIAIQGAGSTFTGGGTLATFGGAIGDGLVFEVISKNYIAVISNTNVIF